LSGGAPLTLQDRKEIAERLYQQGFTMDAIAAQLGVSIQTISTDLKEFSSHLKTEPHMSKRGRKGAGRPKGSSKATIARETMVQAAHDFLDGGLISKNLHRRHLPAPELAMIAADMATLKQGDFKGNQYTAGKEVSLLRDGPLSSTKSAEVVAKEMGISRAAIMDANQHASGAVSQETVPGDSMTIPMLTAAGIATRKARWRAAGGPLCGHQRLRHPLWARLLW